MSNGTWGERPAYRSGPPVRRSLRRYASAMPDDLSTTAEARSSIDRLTFFSDAVVAIAMTLLAIDLPVPTGTTNHEIVDFAEKSVGNYLAFVVSFVVIAHYWRGHHRVYRYVTDAPHRLVATNTFWLLTIVLIPYGTRVLYSGEDTGDSDFPLRFAFYAVLQAASALAFMLSNRAIQDAGILSDDAPTGLLTMSRMRGFVIMAAFLASVPLAFVVHQWAFAAWALLPLWMRIGTRVVVSRHPELASAPS